MTDVIRHRGPDGEGFAVFRSADLQRCQHSEAGGSARAIPALKQFVTHRGDQSVMGQVALGHRRLAILDLSDAGHQPMGSADGRYWVTFNGEVYNFIELRLELESLGHTFHTGTDTEVVLAAFIEWGESCLARFNGMWGLAILDCDRGRIFLARDRFGVKPLYYWVSGSGLIHFASEIKQFTVCPDWEPRLNGSRAFDFLFLDLQDHTDETLFEGVFQLPAGCQMTVEISSGPWLPNSRLPVNRWYKFEPARVSGSLESVSAQFRSLLEDAVALRLRADVNVGSCLSGGLDSTAIVCLADRLLSRGVSSGKQHTFSIYCEQSPFDERIWMRDVVGACNVEAHYVQATSQSSFSNLARVTWQQDEPFGSSGICAQAAVFELAAEARCKVLLDGQGADELLGGYHSFFAARHAGMIMQGNLLGLCHELIAARRNHGFAYRTMLTRALFALAPAGIRSSTHMALRGSASRLPWINRDLLLASTNRGRANGYGRFDRCIRDLSMSQVLRSSLPRLLHFEDRNSMGSSIEARLPFLDYRLAEFAVGLPDHFKLTDGTTKSILRASMRGIIPESVANRHGKLGFATGEPLWATGSGAQAFRDRLRMAVECSGGVINGSVCDHFESVIAGSKPYGLEYWRAMSFGEWSRQFLARVP